MFRVEIIKKMLSYNKPVIIVETEMETIVELQDAFPNVIIVEGSENITEKLSTGSGIFVFKKGIDYILDSALMNKCYIVNANQL